MRHKGVREEILKTVERNEKYLDETISEMERLKVLAKIRTQEKKSKKEAQNKCINELKEFKRKKMNLIKQLIGTAQKQKKNKDMSLNAVEAGLQEDTA